MYLQTFGSLALHNSSFRGEKALILVTYLTLEGPKTRAELSDLLYGRSANARDKLYALVNYLEKRTEGVIERDPEKLRSTVSADVHDLSDALYAERPEDAETLYRGYFLEGVEVSAFSDELERWVLAKRAYFALQVREALLRLGEQAAVNSFEEGARRAESAYLLRYAPEPDYEVFRRVYTLLVAGGHPLAATVCREAASFGVPLELDQVQARRRLRPPLVAEGADGVIGKGTFEHAAEAADALSQRDRQLLLRRVRTVWLDGVLANAVDVSLELKLQLAPGALERPWDGLIEWPYVAPTLAEQGLSRAFREAGHMLLLLGEAGAGKTVSLLELTEGLWQQAEADATAPLPLVFKLGGWAAQGLALFDWLVSELGTWYYVPAALSRRWLETRQFILLLDGLDEVPPSKRQACIEAINAFVGVYGPPGLVVTSRSGAYRQAGARLRLQAALELEPLDDETIERYLSRIWREADETNVDLRADPHLRALARTPAMLRVISSAPKTRFESPLDDLPRASMTTQERVLHAYVRGMLVRKGDAARYTDEDTLRWLSWLAHRMKQHERPVFRLEDLQPNWLGTSQEQRCYRCVAVLFWSLFHFAVISLAAAYLIGIPGNLLLGAVVATFIGFREVQERRYEQLEAIDRPRWSWQGVQQTKWAFWLRWLGVTGLFGLLLTLAGGALAGESPDHLGAWLETVTGSLLFSVPFGLLVGLLEAGLKNRPTELCVGPDRPVLASTRYMFFGSFVLGVLGTLLLSPGFAYLFSAGGLPVTFAFVLGGLIGVSLGFWQLGGMTLIGHYVLRAVLAATNRTPRNPFAYPKFLAYASRLTFLREVGGGYEFFHGLVQEHFAAHYGEGVAADAEARLVETRVHEDVDKRFKDHEDPVQG